jgi:hypothetical protein
VLGLFCTLRAVAYGVKFLPDRAPIHVVWVGKGSDALPGVHDRGSATINTVRGSVMTPKTNVPALPRQRQHHNKDRRARWVTEDPAPGAATAVGR